MRSKDDYAKLVLPRRMLPSDFLADALDYAKEWGGLCEKVRTRLLCSTYAIIEKAGRQAEPGLARSCNRYPQGVHSVNHTLSLH